jgi:hypothetical protein
MSGEHSDLHNFINIAMAARAGGFAVTPLRDKRPFLHAWNKYPLALRPKSGQRRRNTRHAMSVWS